VDYKTFGMMAAIIVFSATLVILFQHAMATNSIINSTQNSPGSANATLDAQNGVSTAPSSQLWLPAGVAQSPANYYMQQRAAIMQSSPALGYPPLVGNS